PADTNQTQIQDCHPRRVRSAEGDAHAVKGTQDKTSDASDAESGEASQVSYPGPPNQDRIASALLQRRDLAGDDSISSDLKTSRSAETRSAAENRDDAVAAIPVNLLQQILAKIGQPATTGGGGATAHTVRPAGEAPATDATDGKEVTEQLKALGGASDVARQQPALGAQATI